MSDVKTFSDESDKKLIVKAYRDLLKSMRGNLDKSSRKQIRLSFEMAAEAHLDMRRKSGEPYILHPLAVAKIVAEEIGLGTTAVICALLHDVVEDTEITLGDIQREFGNNVAKIVDGLTKIKGVFDVTSSEQAENFRKIVLTMAEDIRVILIKIADRLHNMRTLESMSRQKQMRIASETVYLYAPLAHRLGLYNIKSELEDLSMKYLEPVTYRNIAKKLAESKSKRAKYINEFIKPIKEVLTDEGLNVNIYGRPKSIASIWHKMKNKQIEFEDVYDLFAIRIVVDAPEDNEKSDCWKIYSMLTDFYTPSPDRLRDWISTPKSNGYEALHVTVMGPFGKWVEVQIRSKRMEELAEKGLAAHWKYKEGNKNNDHLIEEWLAQVREVLNSSESNALDFINDFKLNLFSEEIYVFTPKGEARTLPAKSTALDFAFSIHSDLGLRCIGAKVNYRLVPLSYELANGDQVEIITSNRQKPNEDWLNFVVTAKAKNRIKDAFKEEKRRRAEDGKELLKKKGEQLEVVMNSDNLGILVKYFKCFSVIDLHFQIATGKIDLDLLDSLHIAGGKFELPNLAKKKKAEEMITDAQFEENVRQELKKNAELVIFGEASDKVAYSLAKCCNPIPGDDVFGYVTATEGLKIHNTKCPNAVNLMSKHAHRIVKTKWSKSHEIAFLTGLQITGIDEVGMISKITDVISHQNNVNMRSISIDSEDGIFKGELMLFVNDTIQLEFLMDELRRVEGIQSVTRLEH
jgi:guanosine-3',5'-bis(diphosphate) 3'-pyrophosphohydrolase